MKNKLIILIIFFIVIGAIYLNKDIYFYLKSLVLETKNVHNNYSLNLDINKSLKEENELLKKQLNLNKTLTEYDIENAMVISRNKTYWFNTLIIDKGLRDGIDKDMLVINENGLIGIVNKSFKKISEVKLITTSPKDNTFHISVVIKTDKDYYGVLNGYDSDNNSLIIKDITKDSNIKIGDEVLTSGIGIFFPKGILIGKVDKILYDQYNLSKNIYVKTNQDFNNIHYVSILKREK